jgi:hypothetical protein
MHLYPDVLSLFEPAGPQDRAKFIYEFILKPAFGTREDLSRSPRILSSLEAGQTEDGYELEGLIHWPGGLLVRLRLQNSRSLENVVERLKTRTAPESGFGWEEEPESVRLIHPEMSENPTNAFTRQMDRIRQTLDPNPFPSIGLFYYHRALSMSVPAA